MGEADLCRALSAAGFVYKPGGVRQWVRERDGAVYNEQSLLEMMADLPAAITDHMLKHIAEGAACITGRAWVDENNTLHIEVKAK